MKIAELERATGVNPHAVDELWQRAGDPMVLFDDPDLMDCGRPWCRKQRGLR